MFKNNYRSFSLSLIPLCECESRDPKSYSWGYKWLNGDLTKETNCLVDFSN